MYMYQIQEKKLQHWGGMFFNLPTGSPDITDWFSDFHPSSSSVGNSYTAEEEWNLQKIVPSRTNNQIKYGTLKMHLHSWPTREETLLWYFCGYFIIVGIPIF